MEKCRHKNCGRETDNGCLVCDECQQLPDFDGTDYSNVSKKEKAQARLKEIRTEIEAERVSYGELAELQDLKEYIEDDDVLLKEWAGIPEN